MGVDTEWADGPTDGAPPVLAVVQLAVEDRAWVIDALGDAAQGQGTDDEGTAGGEAGSGKVGGGDHAREALGKLLRWLLESDPSELIVLGFAFAGDLAMLRPVCGEDAVRSPRTLVDLQVLARQPAEDTPSLKRVCARTIHRRLDKSEQCSDWACRPLRRAQFVYAAQDAHILLGIHTALVG